MKITIAQLDPIVGDINGNLEKMVGTLNDHAEDSDLIVFSELFLTGYPPRDLLEKPAFITEVGSAVNKIVDISSKYPGTGILFGAVIHEEEKDPKGLFNSAILVKKGKILKVCNKSHLPTYDVFDETRYFNAAAENSVVTFKGEKLGITICEDMWDRPDRWHSKPYGFDPVEDLVKKGASILINISASPFYLGKEDIRFKMIEDHAKKNKTPFIFVNQVGGNDELIFDGRSMAVSAKGELFAVLPAFKEHVETIDTASSGKSVRYVQQEKMGSLFDALVMGVRDYFVKSSFSRAILGISGGIDSAVTAVIAKEALGPENVMGLFLPSPYSAEESRTYAKKLVKNLGIGFKSIPISNIYDMYLKELNEDLIIGDPEDVDITLQNIQARIRGDILMAFSNKFEHLVLSTGNKSELAVGYCTLYGDMAGGLAVISDVPKTMVYEIAGYINRQEEVIPSGIIDRAPSAELKPGQVDQDALPPYDLLDKILFLYLEEGYSKKQIIDSGFDPGAVTWIIRAVDNNEYKRQQAPLGLKVTTKAFGSGRRMPIAARYEL